MQRERLWADVKRAYLADEGSLRTLAKRFNVSLDTLEKRCRREGWRRAMAALGGIVAAEAAKMAAQQGQDYAQALLRVRHDLACDLAQSSSMLKGIPHENSLRGVSERNQAIAPLVQNASRVFGWEEHNHGPTHFSLTNVNMVAAGTESDAPPIYVKVMRPDPDLASEPEPPQISESSGR